MGISWVGPAILRFGTEEQKRRFVPRLLRGDDIWATGYSEPGAGSDMYNTQTRAVRDGDHYVINGQKIWTSLAHVSNWYFLLCRTSSEGHKVAGLTLFLIPLKTPGIEIRPTKMITGDSEFSEVFLKDVRVPADSVLGREGQGYEVVSSALINERSGIATAIRFDQSLAKLIETARKAGVRGSAGLAPAHRAARHPDQDHERLRTARALGSAARSLQSAHLGRHEVHRDGAHAALLRGGGRDAGALRRAARWRREAGTKSAAAGPMRFLYDRAMTIAGGTSEIQRNIAAERILGLPRQ